MRWLSTFIQGDETVYPSSIMIALYRAAQEGLTNIQKHAGANRVELRVELGDQQACLFLKDNGHGFDPAMLTVAAAQPGFGLRGIRERLELLRGQLSLESSPHQGTVLKVVVPRNPNG
jgi:signal transduction histidine kinase